MADEKLSNVEASIGPFQQELQKVLIEKIYLRNRFTVLTNLVYTGDYYQSIH